jgi:hypothetical protein
MKSLNRILHNRFAHIHLAFALLSSCSHSGNKFNVPGFEHLQWQKDSLACNGYRYEHYSLLRENKQCLLGSKEVDILDFLGRPNKIVKRSESISFYYYITRGEQCLLEGRNELKLSQNTVIEVLFKDENVINVSIQVP